MMRVLYIVQHFSGPESAGGSRPFEMAKGLVERGHKVTLVCGTRSKLSDRDKAAIVRAGIGLRGPSVRYNQHLSYRRRLLSFAIYATGAALDVCRCERPDVAFASSTPLSVGLVGVVAARWHQVPLVFEVRDLWPQVPIALGIVRKRTVQRAAHAFADFVYRRSSRIVALSPGAADGIAARGVPSDRIAIVPNISHNRAFADRSSRDRTRREMGWDGRLVGIHHGAMGFVNGLSYALDCGRWLDSQGISDVQIALVGDGVERAMLSERIETERIASVRLYPPVPHPDVPMLLAGADVGLMLTRSCPELEWNCANKFFDFLASGLPVIVNYRGWQGECLRTAGAGVSVASGTPEEMGRELIALRDDPQRVNAMGKAARALAEREFDRGKLVRRLEAVLVEAIGRDRDVAVHSMRRGCPVGAGGRELRESRKVPGRPSEVVRVSGARYGAGQ